MATIQTTKQPTMNKEQEDWKAPEENWDKFIFWLIDHPGHTFSEGAIMRHIEKHFIRPLQKEVEEYSRNLKNATDIGSKYVNEIYQLQKENASLQNQNTLLQEDNLAMSKVIAEYKLLDKMNEKM